MISIPCLVLLLVVVVASSMLSECQSLQFDLKSGRTKCISEDIKSNSMSVGKYSVLNPNDDHPMPESHKITVRAMAPPSPPLHAVASESFLLVSSHSRHFLALSLLFLLPPSFGSFSLTAAASSRAPFHTQSLLFRISLFPLPPRHHPLSLSVALFFVSLVFAVLAACFITHSALRAFYGRPVKLLSSLRSTVSYLRMVATLSVSLSPFLLPVAVLFLSDFLLSHCPSSPHLATLSIAASIVALAVAAYSQIIWSLAAVVWWPNGSGDSVPYEGSDA